MSVHYIYCTFLHVRAAMIIIIIFFVEMLTYHFLWIRDVLQKDVGTAITVVTAA